MKRRPHYQERRAHADGWVIECRQEGMEAWSLVERPWFAESCEYRIIPDKDGWLPWYATEDSKCPVPPDTQVEIETSDDQDLGAVPAGSLSWHDCGAGCSIVRYRIVQQAEIDPYAHLKAAAADPTKQIRFDGGAWMDAAEEWSWAYAPERYEIRDKPAPHRKVKLHGFLRPRGGFMWAAEDSPDHRDAVVLKLRRVPSEDREVEVEE